MTALAVLRALGRAGVPVFVGGAGREMISSSRWYRPLPTLLDEPPQGSRLSSWIDALPFDRAVLFPCSDEWAQAIASLPAETSTAFPSVAPGSEVNHTLIDKEAFAEAAERLRVPTPRVRRIRTASDLADMRDDEFEGYFVKPLHSQAFAADLGVKAIPLHERRDAVETISRVTAAGHQVLLQELIPGPPDRHVFFDGYVDRGGALQACLARRRRRMYPCSFGNSTSSETIPLADVEAPFGELLRLFSGIGFVGLFDAEFTFDGRDGVYKLIEVNGRPWWQLALAERCGLDLCGRAYRDALGIGSEPARGYPIGRSWVHPIPDLKAWWGCGGGRELGRNAPWSAWFGGANAIFTWDDPAPAVSEVARAFRSWSGRPRRP